MSSLLCNTKSVGQALRVSLVKPGAYLSASYEERESVAATCSLDLHLSLPVLIEEMDNAMDEAYGAAPERLYLMGADGRVAYRGGAGPHFFDLDEWERAIAASVLSATV